MQGVDCGVSSFSLCHIYWAGFNEKLLSALAECHRVLQKNGAASRFTNAIG